MNVLAPDDSEAGAVSVPTTVLVGLAKLPCERAGSEYALEFARAISHNRNSASLTWHAVLLPFRLPATGLPSLTARTAGFRLACGVERASGAVPCARAAAAAASGVQRTAGCAVAGNADALGRLAFIASPPPGPPVGFRSTGA